MKLKNRQDDASALEWLKTYDWFAELRDDDPAEPADDGGTRPETTTAAAPPASWPTAVAEARARAEVSARAGTPGITPPPTPPDGALGATRREASPLEAVIGDQLRRPVAWCEMGSCIWQHADPAALGEADIRARAISAGWRVDALGRLTCPRCQQTSPDFRASRPVTLWDRDNAITSAALTIAVMRYRRAASSPGWRAAEVIPAGQAAAISRHPAPGTVPETPWPAPRPPASRPAQQEHATLTPRHRHREAPTGQQGHGKVLAERHDPRESPSRARVPDVVVWHAVVPLGQ